MSIPLTARAPVEFRSPALARTLAAENVQRAERGEPPRAEAVFMVRVPTPYERDAFVSALVRGGVVHYDREQIRDLVRAGVAFLYPEDKFEETIHQLEELWQSADALQKARRQRGELFTELMERNTQLAPDKRMADKEIEEKLLEIQPEVQITQATRVRITAVQQDITSRYQPLQQAFADLAEQDTKRAWICIETYLVTWRGLEHQPSGNGHGGVTRQEAEWLRAAIGREAFDEVSDFIFALTSIDADEEKNLASLIESSSAQIGSHLRAETVSDPESEAGSSPAEPTGETPATESPRTSAPSSGSTTRARRRTAASASTPTAAG